MKIINRNLNYKIVMSVSSFTTALMLILLRMIKDVDEIKNSFIINTIIILLLVLINGWVLGDLTEKYFTEEKDVEIKKK